MDRATERALVEAGYAPLSKYVRRATAAAPIWPYPHRTVADVDAARKLGR